MVDLETLKKKYQGVIDYGQKRGVSWKNIHIENNKLLIRGAAPNDAIKNEVWIKIKDIDPLYQDLTADVTIDASLKAPETTYTVAAGDSLSKIAKQFYGDANKYMKIFEANKPMLTHPDKIYPGQKLRIPPQ
jgi:LysM repeat protein